MKGVLTEVIKKPSPIGPDIDLSKYELGEPKIYSSLDISTDINNITSKLGIEEPSKFSYIQVNENAMYEALRNVLKNYGVEVLPLRRALEEFTHVRELAWKLVSPETDKYTAATYLYGGELGYFIYVPPNTKVPTPIYSCLAITSNKKVQFAHNIVYVDEGSEAQVITGCLVPHGVKEGIHIGISEFYVRRGAKLTFVMVHSWSEGVHVRPRTTVDVSPDGEYVSYYVIYSPIASLQTFPTIMLGSNSKTSTTSVIAGSGEGVYDVGSRVLLGGDNSSAEIISKVIATDSSEIYARSDVIAESVSKGHVECLGLLLSPNSKISSIPSITSKKPGAILSHEAAIGIIAQEELEYLMSKGFRVDEAKSVLVRGFIDIDLRGLPPTIKYEIEKLLDIIARNVVGI